MRRTVVKSVLCAASLIICGCMATNANAEEPLQVALVTGVGGLGDESFNDSLYEGILAAEEEYGIEYQLVEPQEYAELADDFNELALDGRYDLIIGCGYEAVEGISVAAEEYPEQQFLLIDGDSGDYENLTSVSFRDNEKTFLVGMMAAMQTKTGKVGMVAATDTPDQHVFVAGYLAGVQYVNPDIETSVKYIGSYDDTATAKELAISMSETGIDVIYAAAGGAGLGVYTAAGDNGFWAIGTDTNLCPSYPDSMFVSAYRNMGNVIVKEVGEAIEGSLAGGVESVGLLEGAVDITNEGSNVEIPDEFLEKVEDAKEKIMNGEIEIPNSLD